MVYKLFLFFLTTAVFWWYGSVFLDPDFGWHLRVGNIIRENGIPKTDPFSYTMPSYPFVDHEWLTDVFISFSYPIIGFSGLALVFALLTTASLFLHASHFNKHLFTTPFLLVATTLFAFAGIRPQIISWLFFSVLLFVTLENRRFQTWRFFIPPFFFLWANLHGGFPAGLVALAIIFSTNALIHRRIPKDMLCILFLSILATLLTPYGIRLWREIWVSASDNALRGTISEWAPMIFMPHLTFWYYVPFSLFFIIRYRKKFTLTELLLLCTFLIAGLASRRHVPFFLILSLPLTANALAALSDEARVKSDALPRLAKAYSVYIVLTLTVIASQLFFQYQTMRSFAESTFYPKQAIVFLQTYPSSGNLCSTYNWGGYLIWKLPEKKVCIDGRMPSWKQRGSVSPNESYNAFEEFQKLGAGDIRLAQITAKYKIDTFLFPPKKKTYDGDIDEAIKNLLKHLFHNTEKKRKYPNLETQLTKDNWIKVYEDPVAAIYRKKKKLYIFPP